MRFQCGALTAAKDMDTASFIATLTPELRQEIRVLRARCGCSRSFGNSRPRFPELCHHALQDDVVSRGPNRSHYA
eukprot:1627176-Amphidinium_carterae.1